MLVSELFRITEFFPDDRSYANKFHCQTDFQRIIRQNLRDRSVYPPLLFWPFLWSNSFWAGVWFLYDGNTCYLTQPFRSYYCQWYQDYMSNIFQRQMLFKIECFIGFDKNQSYGLFSTYPIFDGWKAAHNMWYPLFIYIGQKCSYNDHRIVFCWHSFIHEELQNGINPTGF